MKTPCRNKKKLRVRANQLALAEARAASRVLAVLEADDFGFLSGRYFPMDPNGPPWPLFLGIATDARGPQV